MKPASVLLLCTAALLPAALNAQNVDVGISWADSMPDTLRSPLLPVRVRVQNYTEPNSGGMLFMFLEGPSGSRYYTTYRSVQVAGHSSTVVDFGSVGFVLEGYNTVRCSLRVTGDTYPANDTIRHRVYVSLPHVDVGIAWDPALPDTIGDSVFIFTPRVRVTCHTPWANPPIDLPVYCMGWDGDDSLRYSQMMSIGYYSGQDTTVTFISCGPISYPFAFECSVYVLHDSNPANDTAWWRPYVRGSGVAEEPQPQSVLSGLHALPTYFSQQVTIYCREPAGLFIYNAAGNLVRTLAPAHLAVWDGRDQRGLDLPAGVYAICCGPGRSQARTVKTR